MAGVSTKLLSIDGLGHTFESSKDPLEAIQGIDLTLYQDEFTCLVGPSGCGKSTLLRAIAGLITPTEGEIHYLALGAGSEAPPIGLVFQDANLMPWRTARANIALPLEIAGTLDEGSKAVVRDLIKLVGLEGFEESYPLELSGGMAGRVAIARALIGDPSLLLLDEPFGALDAITRENLSQELLRIWRARGSTILMVTHNINEAILLADRIFVMGPRPGTIVAEHAINLPRPRDLAMLHSPEVGILAAAIREEIRG